MEQNESEYGTVELNGKKYMYLVNDKYDSFLGDKNGNVYKRNYDISERLIGLELAAALDSEIGEGSLLGLSATDLPREFLAGLPIRYVDFLGIAWDDCYPVCYDADRVVEDIYDANGSLLWDTGASTDNLVVDDSYEYVRPKTKKEKEEEHIGEYAGEE